jgi:hypothetical protein
MATMSPLRASLLCVTLIICGAADSHAQFITGIGAGFGDPPILTYDLSLGGDPRWGFVPWGTAALANGRGVEVIGDQVFYTYLSDGFFASDGIHVVDRRGGPDKQVFPNPRPGSGILALSFSRDGLLYLLTGFPASTAEIFGINPTTGEVDRGPVIIGEGALSVATGFVVLPNGRFLIAGAEGSCVFTEFDPVGGTPFAATFRVPDLLEESISCGGVDTDDQSLFFFVNGHSFVQTDLSGNFLSQVGVTSASLMDISLDHGALVDRTPPHTSAGLSRLPNAAGWNNTAVDVILSAVDPPLSSATAGSGVKDIEYQAIGAQSIPDTFTGASAVLPITVEGATTVLFRATDNALNIEDPPGTIGVKIDRTPPVITFTGALKYTVDQTVTINCSSTDAISGIAADTCAAATLVQVPAYTLGVGVTALQATAIDNAGNQTTAAVACTVTVTATSLCALQSQFVQGSPNYVNLTSAQQATVNNTLVSLCQTIGKIVPTLTATQKAALLASYKQGLDKLVKSGWLSASQESTLLALAGRL